MFLKEKSGFRKRPQLYILFYSLSIGCRQVAVETLCLKGSPEQMYLKSKGQPLLFYQKLYDSAQSRIIPRTFLKKFKSRLNFSEYWPQNFLK